MLTLRPYRREDGEIIASWLDSEEALRKWSADRYGAWPITGEDVNRQYADMASGFWPLTAEDEAGRVSGHLILRTVDREGQALRMGYVIVDSSRRGLGLGRELVTAGLRYAFDRLGARRVTLGVFDNNPAAFRCYQRAGFQEENLPVPIFYEVLGQRWRCREMAVTQSAWRSMNRRNGENV